MHQQRTIAFQKHIVDTSDHKYYPVLPDSPHKPNQNPIMVAAQDSVMSRTSPSALKSQHEQLGDRPVSTSPLHVLEPKSSSFVSCSVDEEIIDRREVVASRIKDEKLTKTSTARPADDLTLRETGDLFGDARARGKMLEKSGRYREALENYRVALQCKIKTFASEPKVVQAIFGDILFDIGTIHWQSEHGNPEQSLEAFHFCVQVRRTCFGSNHPTVAQTLCKLASLHASADDHECALQMLLEALYIFLTVTPEDRPSLVYVWIAVGNAQKTLGFVEEAESAFQEAEHIKKYQAD